MKKFVSIFIALFIVALAFVEATDVPYFYLSPSSGTNFKLYCDNEFKLYVSWWNQKYNGFESYIKYDTLGGDIIGGEVSNKFQNTSKFEKIGDMQHVWWAKQWSQYDTWINELARFVFRTSRNITWALFEIVDRLWQVNYGLDSTADGLSLNWFDVSSRDILLWVENVLYNFYAYPCIIDTDKPTVWNVYKSGTTNNVNWQTRISEDQDLQFITYDWNGNKVSHWFSGNSVDDINNYVPVSSLKDVDNQEWVNSGSISIKVSCATCSIPRTNEVPTFIISDWNWENGKNALTWDSQRRWYVVSFDTPFPYEVEKKVTVSISVSDNPNENNETHIETKTISFNAPVSPEIAMLEPSNTWFVSPNEDNFKFYISDDWAWVDTGSVIITTIYSGKEFVYSWSDLSFALSWWSEWLWNAGSYNVTFSPKEDFPIKTEITISVSWADLAGNTVSKIFTFTTRPDCSFYGCRNATTIIWPENIWKWVFTGNVLIVTWVNPDSVEYPKLSGDTLYCSDWEWTGLRFTWNIVLYSGEESLWTSTWYDKNAVYVTWDDRLNIEYQDGKLVVTKQNN